MEKEQRKVPQPIITVEINAHNLGQALFIQAVVMPELASVISKYMADIDSLEE